MANVQQQPSWLDQLGSYLGMGDDGSRGDMSTGMTVPTAYNTSSNWTPPAVAGAGNTPGGAGGSGLGAGIGFNVGTGQLALGGLSALAGIWGSMNQNKLAKDQFKFQKDVTNTNLNNQIKSYNTALEDRMNARGAVEGRSADFTADEIARRRLSR